MIEKANKLFDRFFVFNLMKEFTTTKKTFKIWAFNLR